MGDAKVRLGAELRAEVLVSIPKEDHAFGHVLEMILDALADVARLLQLRDTLHRLAAGCAEQTAVLDIILQLFEVTFQRQRHAKAVLADEHEIIVKTAKALLVGLDTHIRLHHGSTENKIQLIFLQLAVNGTHGATAGCVIAGGFESFVYGYRINLFHRNLRYLHFLLDFSERIVYNIIA
jgi:hypothetical protein